MKPSIVFFGSFQHYSTYVAEALRISKKYNLVGIVTTPPLPAGRKKELQKTHTHLWAEEHNIPVFAPEQLNDQALGQIVGSDQNSKIANRKSNHSSVIRHPSSDKKIDLFVTAGFGKLLPVSWLNFPKLGALNLHFSLLPKYRGANPAEYALLRGEVESGITLIEMGSEFDTGNIIAQTAIDLEPQENRETLYEKLYQLGADCIEIMLTEAITNIQDPASKILPGFPQPSQSPTPDAKRLHRRDGYIAWKALQKLMRGKALEATELPTACRKARVQKTDAATLERASRALYGYPSLWTRIPTKKGQKIMKVLSVKIEGTLLQLDKVQVEGQQKASFNQIKNMIASS